MSRLRQWVQAYGGAAELAIDSHRYGGAVLAAVGLGLWVRPAAGLVLFGVFLVYLGLRPVRRA